MDAAQTVLFETLPVAFAVPADLLARWQLGSFFDGSAPCSVLSWLLLALDDASICGRRDESRLDCDAQHIRVSGENHSKGIFADQGRRPSPSNVGRLVGVFG